MVIEWIDPIVFRWVTIGVWLTAAWIGLAVCGGNYAKAKDRRKEFFRDGPEMARQGVVHRYRIQRRLFIAMISAASVGVIAAVMPRPEPEPVTALSLFGTILLLGFIALIAGLSVEVRRYESEVIEVRIAADDDTLQGIAAQFRATDGDSLRGVVDDLKSAVDELRVSVKQMQTNDEKVARHLVVAQKAVDNLKADVDAARGRADAVDSEEPGEAADAASRSEEAVGQRKESNE